MSAEANVPKEDKGVHVTTSGGARGRPSPSVDRDEARAEPRGLTLAGIYRDHSARLRRFFVRRGASGDADDLVQESFLRLASAEARSPSAIERPDAYISRIAGNLVQERARFAARRSAALHVDIDDVEIDAGDPIAHLEARDMLARLERAMRMMKPTTREIFMAHRIEGYTYGEIAARRGIGVKGVEKQIAKAIIIVNRAMRDR